MGIAIGPSAGWLEPETGWALGDWLALPGKLFLTLIQMVVIPLVIASIIRGLAASESLEQLCRTGLGVGEVKGEKVMELRFIQGRNPDWVHRPFFAQYAENATWINELKPAFGETRFFFEDELEQFYRENMSTSTREDFE